LTFRIGTIRREPIEQVKLKYLAVVSFICTIVVCLEKEEEICGSKTMRLRVISVFLALVCSASGVGFAVKTPPSNVVANGVGEVPKSETAVGEELKTEGSGEAKGCIHQVICSNLI
jgi:hypothetical protein